MTKTPDLNFWSKQTQNILEQQIQQTTYLKQIAACMGFVSFGTFVTFVATIIIVTLILKGCV